MLRDTLRLMLVTDDALLGNRDPVQLCVDAVSGGVTAVQLRLKQASDREILQVARALVTALPVPVFINDRTDIALAADAAGVHLGADDLDPVLARRIVPPGFIIGVSVGSDAEITRGKSADYWGIGPLHGSATKRDAGAALGWSGVVKIHAAAGGIPCIVIGGVQPLDLSAARRAGMCGVAVVSGILAATDPAAAAERYRLSWGA